MHSQQFHPELDHQLQEKFDQALWDNLNTSQLLTELHIALANPHTNTLELIKNLEDQVLKVWLFAFLENDADQEIPEHILKLAEQRKQAKIEKDYALADQLRSKISELGREIKDNKDGFELLKTA